MAHFLRDERLTNLSIDSDTLSQLSAVFADRAAALFAKVPADANESKKPYFTYIIRFDNKGYRVFALNDLLRYFQLAKDIERVLFTVETGESLGSNRQIGTFLELRLDAKDPNTCFLTVTSDDKDFVDASFSAIHDVLVKRKTRNGWVRTAWTTFGVQIAGVTFGFMLSLWAATKIAPKLAIENAFVFAFLFVLLIFSNIWAYLNQRLLWLLNVAFPHLRFVRPDKERLHWLFQAVVGAVVFAIIMYVLSQVFAFFIDMLGGFIRIDE